MSEERFLTVAQICDRYGISKHVVYDAMNDLELPYHNLGGKRIKPSDAEAWIESRRVGPSEDENAKLRPRPDACGPRLRLRADRSSTAS